MDVLFCTDVILNFCTAVIHQGVYHKSYIVIAKHYLKTWFFLDFFGSVPFDKVQYTRAEKLRADSVMILQPVPQEVWEILQAELSVLVVSIRTCRCNTYR